MDNNLEIDGRVVNFDVFNALNLHNPLLGDAYANFNWNPLGDDFRLDMSFIENFLESKREVKKSKSPSFLEYNPKAVMESFKLASKNNQALLDDLKRKYEAGEFVNYKKANIEKQVKDIIFMLECRQKMFQISLGQLNAKGIDPLKAYENISGINRKLAELLEEAYYEQIKKRDTLRRMLAQAQFDAEDYLEDLDNFNQFNQNEQTVYGNPVDQIINGMEDVYEDLHNSNVSINNDSLFQPQSLHPEEAYAREEQSNRASQKEQEPVKEFDNSNKFSVKEDFSNSNLLNPEANPEKTIDKGSKYKEMPFNQ